MEYIYIYIYIYIYKIYFVIYIYYTYQKIQNYGAWVKKHVNHKNKLRQTSMKGSRADTSRCSVDQFWFQLMHHNFTLLTKSLYMFRAPTFPSSGGHKPTNDTVVIRDEVEPIAVYV